MPRLCPSTSRRPRCSTFCIAIGLLSFFNLLILVAFHRWELVSQTSPLGNFKNSSGKTAHDATEDGPLSSISQYGLQNGQADVHILDVLINRTPFTFDPNVFRASASKKYRISSNVLLPDTEGKTESAICLATQGSLGRLHWLMLLAELWDAPVSVAVFVFSRIELDVAKAYISLVRSCSDGVRRNFRFHIAYPSDENLGGTSNMPKWSEVVKERLSCPNHGAVLNNLLQLTKKQVVKNRQKLLYPQNHLRNIARDGCEQEFFFLTDIDVMPRPGLARDLDVFLRNRPPCSKCIYVVPTYETSKSTPVPKTKSELLHMVRVKKARPFHQKVFIYNQYATNHREWERITTTATKPIAAAYRVRKYEFFYEPFYVASKDIPRHDERFVGYGFTRNTQVYEMYLAGFEFWVLDNAFAVHQGMENPHGRDYWREKQNALNRKHFMVFKKEMAKKYSPTAVNHATSSTTSSTKTSSAGSRQSGTVH
ncbi:beta-1,4-glucuronyltransferase 1-like [Ornithodoros turicata]|uniref:beta-1,4-glucuronyltransferase 1-like n=1 Tax=Ornithodoros turicata TaxID=34597 RepID=UPI003138D08E